MLTCPACAASICACSDAPGSLPLYFGKNDAYNTMSTLCTDVNPWFSNVRSEGVRDGAREDVDRRPR